MTLPAYSVEGKRLPLLVCVLSSLHISAAQCHNWRRGGSVAWYLSGSVLKGDFFLRSLK